jgi:hypothetical protein
LLLTFEVSSWGFGGHSLTLKLHGSAGPCDGHIVDGSLVHGRKRMCVCLSFPCLTLPLDPNS